MECQEIQVLHGLAPVILSSVAIFVGIHFLVGHAPPWRQNMSAPLAENYFAIHQPYAHDVTLSHVQFNVYYFIQTDCLASFLALRMSP